jgi:hypothetical protein
MDERRDILNHLTKTCERSITETQANELWLAEPGRGVQSSW